MTQPSEKKPPIIVSDEDAPFSANEAENSTERDFALTKEKSAENPFENKKFNLGSNILGWCIALMFICVLLSLRWPDKGLLNNAFEAFKLIITTILGYLFGSQNSNNSK